MRTRPVRKAVVLPLLGLLRTGSSAAATTPAACGGEPEDPPPAVGVPLLDVTLTADHDSYRRGAAAQLTVTARLDVPNGPKASGGNARIDLLRGDRRVLRTYVELSADGTGRITARLPSTGSGVLKGHAEVVESAVPSNDCRGPLVAATGSVDVDPLLRLR